WGSGAALDSRFNCGYLIGSHNVIIFTPGPRDRIRAFPNVMEGRMGMKGRILALLAGAAVVASIAVTAASGAQRLDPGITSTSVKIGGTFPLTGPAALYKTIPSAEKAYFDYVNDHGGVNGRKINFEILDDSYDPSKTVPLAQQLVEKDGVFAVFGSLGTAPTLATWGYLNSHKVPQVLVA